MSRGFTENFLLPVLSFTQHFGCSLNWVMERWQQLYEHKGGSNCMSTRSPGNEVLKHEQRSGGRSQQFPWFKVPFRWFLKEEN